MKKIIVILTLFSFSLNLLGQQSKYCIGPLKLTCFSGEYSLEGLYRQKEFSLNSNFEKVEAYRLNHTFKLNTNSYVWHPNFMTFTADLEYSPGNSEDNYLVNPDLSEFRTAKKIDINTTFFKTKPVNLSLFGSLNETNQNREYLSSIKTNSKKMGAVFNSNLYIPISIGYTKGEQYQEEIATGRKFNLESNILEGRMSKSFSDFDKSNFSYTHNDYTRVSFNEQVLKNSFDRFKFNNVLHLDKAHKYTIRSLFSNHNQQGKFAFKRLTISESIFLKLPKRFTFNGRYRYLQTDQAVQLSDQHSAFARISNKLYESLNTSGYVEYFRTNSNFYTENLYKTGVDIQYTKKIPFGVLYVVYNYYFQRNEMNSQSIFFYVSNNEITIEDNNVIMLKHAYIDINSIVVKDQTGSIVYQNGLDFLLIEHDNFIEIRRVPGGQITNNQTVYIDYVAKQTGDYNYDSHHSSLSARVSLFKRKLELYYRRSDLDFFNIQQADFLTLNYLQQDIYGGAIKYGVFKVGAEYIDYNSTITPYYKWKYFAEVQLKLFKKMFFVLNADKQDYVLLNNNIKHSYNSVNARLAYQFRGISKIEMQTGYRQQKGLGIDLELLTSRIEFSTIFRKIHFSVGVEMYKRDYLNQKINFNGGFIKLSRKFN